MSSGGWVGVDLDGTLAIYDGWVTAQHIGEPVPDMVTRVKAWIENGVEVRIFTARVSVEDEAFRQEIEKVIEVWCEKHIGQVLPITNEKDFGMIELWDDRCVQVVANTGRPVGETTREALRVS